MKELAKKFGPIAALFVAVLAAVLGVSHKPPQPHTFGATGVQPVLNPNWAVTAWFVDFQNSTGCASDTNSCTSATCGSAGSGIGPCATWHQINDIRWGCLGSPRGCPRFITTAHFFTDLSSVNADTDPRYVYPALEDGASLTFKAALPTPTLSATFTSVSQTQSACGAGIVNDTLHAIGNPLSFIIDTPHSARAWCDEFSASNLCNNSTFMTAVSPPPIVFTAPGIWVGAGTGSAGTIGNTDAYTQYTSLIAVDFVDLQPIIADWNGAQSNGVFIYDEKIYDPGGVGKDVVNWGPGVTGYEVRSDRIVNVLDNTTNRNEGCVNCLLNGGLIGGRNPTGNYWHMEGGEVTTNGTICNITGAGIAIDGINDFYANCSFTGGLSIGLIQFQFSTLTVGGNTTFAQLTPGYTFLHGVQGCGSSATLNLSSGVLAYDASHGGSAGIFPGGAVPTFQIGGSSLAESHSGTTPVVVTGGITITTTTLDTAASTTNFGGTAYGRSGVIKSL